jgi:hypothetical protein
MPCRHQSTPLWAPQVALEMKRKFLRCNLSQRVCDGTMVYRILPIQARLQWPQHLGCLHPAVTAFSACLIFLFIRED